MTNRNKSGRYVPPKRPAVAVVSGGDASAAYFNLLAAIITVGGKPPGATPGSGRPKWTTARDNDHLPGRHEQPKIHKREAAPAAKPVAAPKR
jgi:hypothetical protein